jgi:modification methylase
MPDNFVDLVVTSPPYNLGNSKKGSFYGGKNKGLNIEYIDHDDDMDTGEYINWQHSLFVEWMRILKPSGAIFYNHKPRILNGIYDDRKNLIPFPIRQELIWNRCGMINFSGSFFAPNTEKIYIIVKGDWKPNKECVGFGEIWTVTPDTGIQHPAPYPLNLVKKIIVASTKQNDLVYDPFMGSGTTAIGSHEHKRNWIGSEISKEYVELANKRLSGYINQIELI